MNVEFPLKTLVGARVCNRYSDLLVSGNAPWVSLLPTVNGCFPSNTFSVVYLKKFILTSVFTLLSPPMSPEMNLLCSYSHFNASP